MGEFKALILGDIIGEPGLAALKKGLGPLRAEEGIDLVLANGENAADGFGLSPPLAEAIFACGVDVISSGNHIWQKREIWPMLDKEERLLRPANYPASAPGHGMVRLSLDGVDIAVINLQGREFMSPIDCPFMGADALLTSLGFPPRDQAIPDRGSLPIVLVDFHAESSEEKEALGFYLDGRVSALVGTHTHVQTADDKILPKGTAYLSDLGMCGPRDSVIGMKPKICVDRSLTQMPLKMEVGLEEGCLQGLIIGLDKDSRMPLWLRRLDQS